MVYFCASVSHQKNKVTKLFLPYKTSINRNDANIVQEPCLKRFLWLAPAFFIKWNNPPVQLVLKYSLKHVFKRGPTISKKKENKFCSIPKDAKPNPNEILLKKFIIRFEEY
jgi:hypothetical protein